MIECLWMVTLSLPLSWSLILRSTTVGPVGNAPILPASLFSSVCLPRTFSCWQSQNTGSSPRESAPPPGSHPQWQTHSSVGQDTMCVSAPAQLSWWNLLLGMQQYKWDGMGATLIPCLFLISLVVLPVYQINDVTLGIWFWSQIRHHS